MKRARRAVRDGQRIEGVAPFGPAGQIVRVAGPDRAECAHERSAAALSYRGRAIASGIDVLRGSVRWSVRFGNPVSLAAMTWVCSLGRNR